MKIINKNDLLKSEYFPEINARRVALESLEFALNAADPLKFVSKHITLKKEELIIDNSRFNLKKFNKIIIVGGGKASGRMAQALEKMLGKRIHNGIINVLEGTSSMFKTDKIELMEASHPIPNIKGIEGVKRMFLLAEKIDHQDLIICLISGGGSSLMPYPIDGISLKDKQDTTKLLLNSGATIKEINYVRKHLSNIKGGRLAKTFYPATIISLIISDVINDSLDTIASGPTVPDNSTFDDAINILNYYQIWNKVPNAIRKVLVNGSYGIIPETPKTSDKFFKKVHNFIIGNNWSACMAAQKRLKHEGFHTMILTPYIQGEAKEVGKILSSIIRSIDIKGKPIKRPAAIISGGETEVTVKGSGKGGRNQELVLSASMGIEGIDKVAVVSMSTDGVDGVTNVAGAIADGNTIHRALHLKLNPNIFLKKNDSFHFFEKLKDLLISRPTGTNVSDIIIFVLS